MADTPDFELLAQHYVAQARRYFSEAPGGPVVVDEALTRSLRKQFADIWNARGAADIAKIDATISDWNPELAKDLDRALRGLDR